MQAASERYNGIYLSNLFLGFRSWFVHLFTAALVNPLDNMHFSTAIFNLLKIKQLGLLSTQMPYTMRQRVCSWVDCRRIILERFYLKSVLWIHTLIRIRIWIKGFDDQPTKILADPDPKTAKNQFFHAMFGPVFNWVSRSGIPNSRGPKGPPPQKKERVKKAYVFCVRARTFPVH
jgi:hypothetical protein